MKSFVKAAAKNGSFFRIGAAGASLGIAVVILVSTMSGLDHGKMYLGPKFRSGIIVYCWKNPFGFVAITAGNFLVVATLLSFSSLEMVSMLERKRRGNGPADASSIKSR